MSDSNDLQLWYGKVSAEDAHYQAYWRVLDADEQAHAEKLHNAMLHQRYVEIHGRLRKLLALTLKESPERIKIKKAEHGKPYLVDYPDVAFNLSHTADLALIAVARQCRLGVDVEICKPRHNLSGLVAKCFAEEEAVFWQQLPESEKIQAFYQFWTKKEAFVKATGYGIVLGLNRCVINPQKQTTFLSVPDSCGSAAAWHTLDVDLGQGICGAVVADKPFAAVRLMDFAEASEI